VGKDTITNAGSQAGSVIDLVSLPAGYTYTSDGHNGALFT
jgi:hypothetical protein